MCSVAPMYQPFEQSKLFLSDTKEKIVDEDKRRSKYRAIVDGELFDLAENLVQHLSSLDKEKDYLLVRNDVTNIVYTEGGFFKVHEVCIFNHVMKTGYMRFVN